MMTDFLRLFVHYSVFSDFCFSHNVGSFLRVTCLQVDLLRILLFTAGGQPPANGGLNTEMFLQVSE